LHEYREIETEEIQEIHEEEKLSILELEEILALFLGESERSAAPFPEFMTGVWWTGASVGTIPR
jgi:hypothetical protein